LLIGNTLIDTGISSGYLRKLKRRYPIENVILSHWHEDHISGNRLMKKVQFFAHQKDVPVIENVEKMYDYYFVNELLEQTELFDMILQGLRLKDTKVNQIIFDNQVIDFDDGFNLKVIHTPGHSAGHCCFIELKTRIAFFGDIDLSSFGPWYAAKDSSLVQFINSIKKIKEKDINIAVTSHKGIVTGKENIQRSLEKYLEKLSNREEQIISQLANSQNGLSLADLTAQKIIYKRYSEYEVYERMAEKVMIKQHLEKLLGEGIIKKEEDKYILP
jgi:glyoxylase-like metal-dependent hydrolase (beta-lactamase superfamily II)